MQGLVPALDPRSNTVLAGHGLCRFFGSDLLAADSLQTEETLTQPGVINNLLFLSSLSLSLSPVFSHRSVGTFQALSV